jgi:hypothetical protein
LWLKLIPTSQSLAWGKNGWRVLEMTFVTTLPVIDNSASRPLEVLVFRLFCWQMFYALTSENLGYNAI